MKKLALLLVVVMFGTAAFAAAPKAATKTAPASGGKAMTITAISISDLGCPSIRLGLGALDLDLAASISSPAAGTTNHYIMAKGLMQLGKVNSSVNTYWAPWASITTAAGVSTTQVGISLGAEYMFASKLAIFGEINALRVVMTGGTTTWFALTNNAQAYTGVTLYL